VRRSRRTGIRFALFTVSSPSRRLDHKNIARQQFHRRAGSQFLDTPIRSLKPITANFAGRSAGHAERGDSAIIRQD
jgi:hypothetical protein